MDMVLWIATVLLVLGLGLPGMMKLTSKPMALEAAERLGYEKLLMPLGVIEIVAPVALVIGALSKRLEWLGVLAALGTVGLMIGAIIYHRRVGDTKEMIPGIVLLVAAVAYLIAIA